MKVNDQSSRLRDINNIYQVKNTHDENQHICYKNDYFRPGKKFFLFINSFNLHFYVNIN